MPRVCTVCRNPQRNEIDTALISNSGPLQTIADRHGLSKTAVLRHRDSCLPAHLVKAKEFADVQSASTLVRELRELTKRTSLILARAMREKDGDLALKAINRLERQLELKARLLGELEDRGGTAPRLEVVYVDKALILRAASSPPTDAKQLPEGCIVEPLP